MNKLISAYSILCLSLLTGLTGLTGCAVGPLMSNESARTVGNSNHELIAGYGVAGYVLKWNYGATENLDLGLQFESFSFGLRAKYAFINSRDQGWSLATALGTGASAGGSHYYGDLIGSCLVGPLEPYATIRVVHVKTDPFDLKDQSTDLLSFTVDKSQYNYGQFILGSRYWFNPHWLISLEASTFVTTSSGFDPGRNGFFGASFGYKF